MTTPSFFSKLKKWYTVCKYRLTQAIILKWKRVPETEKKIILYIGNYTANAIPISYAILYLIYFDNIWLRFLGIIPFVTIMLIYIEYYYKWFRRDFRD